VREAGLPKGGAHLPIEPVPVGEEEREEKAPLASPEPGAVRAKSLAGRLQERTARLGTDALRFDQCRVPPPPVRDRKVGRARVSREGDGDGAPLDEERLPRRGDRISDR
jgi:hypothetical protein